MAHYNWNPATRHDYPGAVLVATADDGATTRLHLDYFDDDVQAAFVIELGYGRFISTESTEDWPEVERYLPRAEWPEEMPVGKRGPEERHPDPAVVEAIAAYRRMILDALDA